MMGLQDLQDFRPEISAIQLQCMVTLQRYCWSKLQQQQQIKKEHECCRYLFPPTYTLFPAYASYRNYSHFVIYEHIAPESTFWIYADSLWDQFNSSWGMRGEKP